MLKEKIVSDDVVKRAWRKVDEIAKSKGMTRDEFINWSDKEIHRKNISDYEYQLIYAYQTEKVISRLEGEKIGINRDVWDRYLYMHGRIKDFRNIEKAIKHLTEVCAYIQDKYGTKYKYEWLLDDDNLYNRIIDEGEKGNKRSKPKKDY